jgi:hypothetical protein
MSRRLPLLRNLLDRTDGRRAEARVRADVTGPGEAVPLSSPAAPRRRSHRSPATRGQGDAHAVGQDFLAASDPLGSNSSHSRPIPGRNHGIRAAGRCWSSPFTGDDARLSPWPPVTKGEEYLADPPTIEEIGAVMRAVGDRPDAHRIRALNSPAVACGASDQRSARYSGEAILTADAAGACSARERRQASRGWDGPMGMGAARPVARDPS